MAKTKVISAKEAASLIKDGDTVVLVGFGGGLSWASALIKWKEIK